MDVNIATVDAEDSYTRGESPSALAAMMSIFENQEITEDDEGSSTKAETSSTVAPRVEPPQLVVLRDLSEPITATKEECIGRNSKKLKWGLAFDQGKRRSMEDSAAVVPSFMKMTCEQFGGCMAPGSQCAAKESSIHYFGIFDGHGGSQVSDYCSKRLHEALVEEWGRHDETIEWSERWQTSLVRAFQNVDSALKLKPFARSMGSTAAVVIVSPCQIIAANCGDSRAVLCRGNRAIPLTIDQKPAREDEAQRIINAGGRISFWGCPRVEGFLAMTRAIGDQDLKRLVISVPEISLMRRSEDDEFLVLASDGLWDVMNNEEVVSFAREKMREKRPLTINCGFSLPRAQLVASKLIRRAIARRSTDNIGIIVIDLKRH